MKLSLILMSIMAFGGGCSGAFAPKNYAAVSAETIEYQNKEGDFVVVILEGDDMSLTEARHLSRQKAAQMAFDQGYRYIVIEEEGETDVVASKKPWPSNQGFHQNMYQELIIEHDEGRESLQRQGDAGIQNRRGYRLVFKAYEESPGWNAIDVCTLITCY